VLVGEDGQVKLTDFGISRNVSEVTMTNSGMVLGTPAYIAPEVAAGDPVTNAADLWSLGATLFAAVTGHPPTTRATTCWTRSTRSCTATCPSRLPTRHWPA